MCNCDGQGSTSNIVVYRSVVHLSICLICRPANCVHHCDCYASISQGHSRNCDRQWWDRILNIKISKLHFLLICRVV